MPTHKLALLVGHINHFHSPRLTSQESADKRLLNDSPDTYNCRMRRTANKVCRLYRKWCDRCSYREGREGGINENM